MVVVIKMLFLNPSTLIRTWTDLSCRVLTILIVLMILIMEVSTFTMIITRLTLIMVEQISSSSTTTTTEKATMKSSNHPKITVNSHTKLPVNLYKARGFTMHLLSLSIKTSTIAQKWQNQVSLFLSWSCLMKIVWNFKWEKRERRTKSVEVQIEPNSSNSSMISSLTTKANHTSPTTPTTRTKTSPLSANKRTCEVRPPNWY